MNAVRDENRVTSLLGWNGTAIAPLKVNPVTGALLVVFATTASPAVVGTRAVRDENRVVSQLGVSSVDGVTPVPIHCNVNGLLCKSN